MNTNNDCKIYINSEYVTWYIPKTYIENLLIKKDKLLFLNVETGGEINFSDTTCKINNNNEKICDKKIINDNNIKYKLGNKDEVMTPLAVVNFHTHPINCYIDVQTIWGWPSGEDLCECLLFANDDSLTHIIFAVEGTYIIDVNKNIINYLKNNNTLLKLISKNVENIFKLSHKHRMVNNNNDKISLEEEFNNIFLKVLKLPQKKNILLSWLNLVNNLNIENLVILSNNLCQYFSKIKKLSLTSFDKRFVHQCIFNIKLIKNKTIQWNNSLNKNEIFNKILSKKLDIKLPDGITYKAPYISEHCKLY